MLRDLLVGQNRLDRAYPSSSAVIPGRAKREPGIHNHNRTYGFRTAFRGFRNDELGYSSTNHGK
jgi:hypothetical protein